MGSCTFYQTASPHTQGKHVEFILKGKDVCKDHYHNNFVMHDVVESKTDLGDTVEVNESPYNWKYKRHQWHNCLDLTHDHKPSLSRDIRHLFKLYNVYSAVTFQACSAIKKFISSSFLILLYTTCEWTTLLSEKSTESDGTIIHIKYCCLFALRFTSLQLLLRA